MMSRATCLRLILIELSHVSPALCPEMDRRPGSYCEGENEHYSTLQKMGKLVSLTAA